jgi:hypothetical protein
MAHLIEVEVVDFFNTELKPIKVMLNIDSIQYAEAMYQRHLEMYAQSCKSLEEYNLEMVEKGTPQDCKKYLPVKNVPKNCTVVTLRQGQLWIVWPYDRFVAASMELQEKLNFRHMA